MTFSTKINNRIYVLLDEEGKELSRSSGQEIKYPPRGYVNKNGIFYKTVGDPMVFVEPVVVPPPIPNNPKIHEPFFSIGKAKKRKKKKKTKIKTKVIKMYSPISERDFMNRIRYLSMSHIRSKKHSYVRYQSCEVKSPFPFVPEGELRYEDRYRTIIVIPSRKLIKLWRESTDELQDPDVVITNAIK